MKLQVVYKFLFVINLILSGCGGGGSGAGGDSIYKEEQISFENRIKPTKQMVRHLEAHIEVDSQSLIIENLGWCETQPGVNRDLHSGEQCQSLSDYSKINYGKDTYYIYRATQSVNIDRPIESKFRVGSEVSRDATRWESAMAELSEKAVKLKARGTIKLKNLKHQSLVLHKLYQSRCKSSRGYFINQKRHPLKINRFVSLDNIFYLDSLIPVMTSAEIDLKSEKIVRFPIILKKDKKYSQDQWKKEISFVVAKEVTNYQSLLLDQASLDWYGDQTASKIGCSKYYGELIKNSFSNDQISFYPTFNSSLDKAISKKVNEYSDEHKSLLNTLKISEIMSVDEVDALIPVVENLTQIELKFLKDGGYEILTMKQFKGDLYDSN